MFLEPPEQIQPPYPPESAKLKQIIELSFPPRFVSPVKYHIISQDHCLKDDIGLLGPIFAWYVPLPS